MVRDELLVRPARCRDACAQRLQFPFWDLWDRERPDRRGLRRVFGHGGRLLYGRDYERSLSLSSAFRARGTPWVCCLVCSLVGRTGAAAPSGRPDCAIPVEIVGSGGPG